MNEIEKLYENTVGKQSYCTANDCLDMSKCEGCCFCKRMYPPFTANKQIELIKWLVKNQDIFQITYHREFLWCSGVEWVESDWYEEFEESLADLLNTIWQSLTEEERKQIKEILE